MNPPLALTRSKRISLYHPSLLPLLRCRSHRHVLQVHPRLLKSSLLSDPFAASRLLKTSLLHSPLPYSLLLFRSLPNPDAFSLNVLLSSLPSRQALPFFFASIAQTTPNSYSFPPLAAAAARSRDVAAGEAVHCQAVKRGVSSVTNVTNSLVHMYFSFGLLSSARSLFDEMPDRDLVSWNTLLNGLSSSGDLDAAREVFDRMPERNVVSWNVMINGYLRRRGEVERGLGLVREMGRGGVKGSVVTVASVAAGCARGRRVMEGRAVHGYFVRVFLGEEENLVVGTALVDMYGKCGRLEVARRVFDGMRERNLVAWNAMLLGYCIRGEPEDGIALFREMVEEGEAVSDSVQTKPRVLPDELTFVGILCACARGELLGVGKKYFEEMTSLYHLKPTFAHYWCMANLYSSLGLVQEAEEVLKGMPEETESLVWSNLLGYCRFRGDTELGEQIAKRLIELEPYNSSRYSLLWNIYMAANRMEDAKKVEETMKKRGLRVMPDGKLVDLNEIVHNFKVGDRSQPEIEEIYMMMDELAARLKLAGLVAPDSSEGSKLQEDTNN